MPLFGKKSLEKQIHADGINRRDSERVADSAIRRRAASLHQNIFLAAEANDVPDDQKIARQIEFFDQRQFALNLPPRFLIVRAVTRRSFLPSCAAAGNEFCVSPSAHGIFREFVAQILEREFKPRGKLRAFARWLREDRRKDAPSVQPISDGARNCAPAGVPRLRASRDGESK